MKPGTRAFGLPVLLAVLLFSIAASVAIGPVQLSIGKVIGIIFGSGTATERAIVLELRMPRALVATLIGGALALSGAVFQALLRNPLAEPYVLGISGGAAVGAVSAIVLGLGVVPGTVPLAALLGAVLAIVLVLRIALRAGNALDTRVLLLAGVIVGAFFNAVILLLVTSADVESFRSAMFWIMGTGLATSGWRMAAWLAAYTIPASLLLIALARPFNLLAAGDETAFHLGIRITRMKTLAYLIASMLVAVSVAACGVIGFVGLVIPHAVRLLWGGEHRFLLPASFLAGGTFLLFADTAARTVNAPAELPTGVVTALIGVPVFLVLLRRSST